MKKVTFLLIAAVFATTPQKLFAWSGLEHDAITYIAECNLKTI